MKKLILLLSLLVLSNAALAYNYSDSVKNSVNVNQKINYLPDTKTWTKDYKPDSVSFVKHITVGSGSYSEYENDKTFYDTYTTYEFLDGGRLIGHNMHLLKFFELGFDEKITQRNLTCDEVKELFPNVQIIKISQFKKNKIVLKKPKNVKRTYLLVNDTDRDFYKYIFENSDEAPERIKGLFEVEKPQKLVYSHFGSRDKMFPILKIVIKDSIFAR